MTQRITDRDLDTLAMDMNDVFGLPREPWRVDCSPMTANIGSLHVYHAYGHVSLHQMATAGGGVREILDADSKRGLYRRMRAMMVGAHLQRKVLLEGIAALSG